jgi:type IV pilus assembly protein PilC
MAGTMSTTDSLSPAALKKEGGLSVAVDRIFHRPLISDKEKSEFCTQLAVMLQAGVSLHRSLEVLARQTKSEKLKSVVQNLSDEIKKGNSFARALAAQNDLFDSLFVVTAEVGQESGRLPEVLAQLASHLEKINALKRKFRQAMTYPALVLTVSVLAVSFLLAFIVPAFAEMFKSFQIELPLSTTIVLSMSDFLTQYGPYGIVLLTAAIVMFRGMIARPATRQKAEQWVLKIPLLGDVVLKNYVARFCRTLGTLLHAQVALVDALGVTQRIFTNDEVRAEIGTILKHVRQGQAVAEPLVESKLFPPMVAQMIAVGEETSELDTMLLKVADYYEKEIDSKVETLSSVIEPVIILLLGILVALILISMYLPMFDLVSVVGGGM